MILIQRIHQDFKLNFNKLNSNHNLDLPAAYIDDLANRAINEYQDIFFHGTNAKKFKIGFEVIQQRLDMLSNLVEKDKFLAPISTDSTNSGYDIYEFDLSQLNPEYKTHVKSKIDCVCGKIDIGIKQHNDIESLLKYKDTFPSLDWKRIYGLIAGAKLGTQDKSSMYVYTPSNSFVTRLQIDYLRKTPKVFSGGYNTLEYAYGDLSAYNINSPIVHCELKEEYLHILVSIMVDIMARILSDSEQVQLMQDKLINQY